MSILITLAVLLLPPGAGWGDFATDKPLTGTARGAEMPLFFGRAVTGPDAGKTLCYVCKYEERPVAMVFVRSFEDGLEEFLIQLDKEVEKHGRQSLRCCVFFCGLPPMKLQPKLATLAHDAHLRLPLVIPAEYQTGPAALELDQEAALTVVLYRARRIVDSRTLPAGKLTVEHARELAPSLSKTLLSQ